MCMHVYRDPETPIYVSMPIRSVPARIIESIVHEYASDWKLTVLDIHDGVMDVEVMDAQRLMDMAYELYDATMCRECLQTHCWCGD